MSAPGVHFASRLTHGATLAAVVGGLLPMPGIGGVRYASVVALGVLYGLVCTRGVSVVDRLGAPARKRRRGLVALYFSVAGALALLLVGLSRGYGFIAILPLVSHVVLYAGVLPGLGAGVGLMLAVFAAMSPPASLGAALSSMGGVGSAVVFVLVFSLVFKREVTWRALLDEARLALAGRNEELRRHAEEIEELAALRERSRLAREVHDGLGHYLTGIHVQLEAAKAHLPPSSAVLAHAVGQAQQLARQGLADVRRSVSLMRESQEPAQVGVAAGTDAPLSLSLGRISAGFATSQTAISFSSQGEPREVSPGVVHALERVLQESLSNVVHHARARRVEVTLSFSATALQLQIDDDGQGAEPSEASVTSAPAVTTEPPRSGSGLRGMRERLASVGGTLALGPSLQGGLSVRAEVAT